jgi:hypothetical protein
MQLQKPMPESEKVIIPTQWNLPFRQSFFDLGHPTILLEDDAVD